MTPTPYADVLADNIRAARSRAGIGQDLAAARMRALGFEAWIRQTVGSTERGRRRATAEEILGLAIVLGTSVRRLMSPLSEDKSVELPSSLSLGVAAVEGYVTGEWITDARILWKGDTPFLNPAPGEYPVEDGES